MSTGEENLINEKSFFTTRVDSLSPIGPTANCGGFHVAVVIAVTECSLFATLSAWKFYATESLHSGYFPFASLSEAIPSG